MSEEKPLEILTDIETIPNIPLAEQIRAYRKLFPKDKPSEMGGIIETLIKENGLKTLIATDLTDYARNYTAQRLGLLHSTSPHENIDGLSKGSMNQITNRLIDTGVLSEELVDILITTIGEMVDINPAIVNISKKYETFSR